MGVLGALGALPADVDVSVGSVLPEARALKGSLESSTLGASLRPPWAARTPLIAQRSCISLEGCGVSSRGREGGERRWNGAGWDGAAAAAAAAWERPAWERPFRVVYPASTAKECLFRRLPGLSKGRAAPRHEALLAGAKKDS